MTETHDRRAEYEEERRLLQRFRDGDTQAYGVLFDKYWDASVGYAHRFSWSGADPQDLAQEAFTKVMETVRRGKGPTISLGHYLHSTIRTIAITHRERNTFELPVEEDKLSALFEATAQGDEAEIADWLVEGFNGLGPRQQYVVWEYAIEQRSFRDIASRSPFSLMTASRTYQSAMKDLRIKFATAVAQHSPDPQCALFIEFMVDQKPASGAFQTHLVGCVRCQTAQRKLSAKDRALVTTLLVSGLGSLGVTASQTSTGSGIAAWYAALAWQAKAALILASVAVLALGGVAVSHLGGDEGAADGAGAGLDLVLGQSQGNSALASVGECRAVREPVSDVREIWRLAGGAECGMRIEVTDAGTAGGATRNPAGPVTLLDTRTDPARVTLEVSRVGHYTIEVWEGGVSQRVEVDVRR